MQTAAFFFRQFLQGFYPLSLKQPPLKMTTWRRPLRRSVCDLCDQIRR